MPAQGSTSAGSTVQIASAVESLVDAYRRLRMGLRQYLLLVLLPAFVVFLAALLGSFLLPFPLVVRVPVFMLGGLMLVTAVFYPQLRLEQQRRGLENQLHLLITHMTVLSTTNIDRVEVFRTLAREEEYGELATEMNRIVQLVDTWNQSLDEACQRRAREVPSKPLSDFLDRLSYSLGSGQSINDFLLGEQNAIIQQYVTVYEGRLENIGVMKDLYLSMILSMTFGLVNAIVLPILTGTDATLVIAAVIVIFVFVQLGFFWVIRTITPHDPIWYQQASYQTDADRRMAVTLYGSFALSVAMAAGSVMAWYGAGPFGPDAHAFLASVPVPFLLAGPLTPLAIPGVVARKLENDIKERDEEFPNFIRALGASESAKQSTTTAVLRTLRSKDFGVLSPNIDRLFVRLKMRIAPEKAWFYFTAETSSYLVQKFSEMYLVGRQMGGEPKQLGELISTNMNQVLQLRRQRNQLTVTLVGVLYGITASAVFAFFIGLEVVDLLAELSTNISMGSFDLGVKLIYAGAYDIPLIEYMLTMVILFNALLSSLMVRTVDGGHKANSHLHFVLLVWVGCLLAVATSHLAGALLSV